MVDNKLSTRMMFPEEEVVVNIPPRAKPIQALRLDLPKDIPMEPVPGGFRPFRLVINLKLVDAEQPDNEVLVFDPPIEVRVRYTAGDLAKAKSAGGPLSLGFWDGKQWIRFTREKHQFHLEPSNPPESGGWGVVNVSHWGDPTHSWGT
jgi:hypothetical protein